MDIKIVWIFSSLSHQLERTLVFEDWKLGCKSFLSPITLNFVKCYLREHKYFHFPYKSYNLRVLTYTKEFVHLITSIFVNCLNWTYFGSFKMLLFGPIRKTLKLKPWGEQLTNHENLKKMLVLSWKIFNANYYGLNLLPTNYWWDYLAEALSIKLKYICNNMTLVVEYWLYKIRYIFPWKWPGFVKFWHFLNGKMSSWQKLNLLLQNKEGVQKLKLYTKKLEL